MSEIEPKFEPQSLYRFNPCFFSLFFQWEISILFKLKTFPWFQSSNTKESQIITILLSCNSIMVIYLIKIFGKMFFSHIEMLHILLQPPTTVCSVSNQTNRWFKDEIVWSYKNEWENSKRLFSVHFGRTNSI